MKPKEAMGKIATALRSHREEIETLSVNGVLTVMIVLLALAAGTRLGRLHDADARVKAVHEALRSWPAKYEAPSQAERQLWSTAAVDIERLGVKPAERLFLAQMLGRSAENAGVPDARVRFTAASGGEPRVVGTRRFMPADYGAIVELESSFATGVEFIAQLPGAVSIQSLSLRRGDYALNMEFVLQPYQPAAGAQ